MSKPVSNRSAIIIGIAAVLIHIGYYVLLSYLPFEPNTPFAGVVAIVLVGVVFGTFGAIMTALNVYSNGWVVSPREFLWLAIDFALLPIILPMYIVTTAFLVGGLVGFFCTNFFDDDLLLVVFGLEFGVFAVLIAIPFSPLLWPVFSRGDPSGSASPDRIAAPPFVIPIVFAPLSVLVLFVPQSLLAFIIFVSAWGTFFPLYKYVFYDRFPRFTMRRIPTRTPS